MIKIIEKWKIWIALSLIVIIPGVIALSVYGLNLGIDFSGGTLIEIQFPSKQSVTVDEISKVFADKEIKNAQISLTSKNSFLSRTHVIDHAQYLDLNKALTEKIGTTKEVKYETVGPTVSKDLATKAVWALVLASIMIIIYIAWAFRSVPKPLSSWKFGISAVIALVHDLITIIGIFAILGHFMNVEVDTLFITALLTIMGFSVHDTIVVFDRIRENLKTTSGDLVYITNKSITETMSRSISTSATVLFTLLALLLFGGASTFWFIFALFIGIIVGTYSSIFVASVIMVLWHKGTKI
ncbi:MAG TPA: protein translocase subunit SecF [Patescibacteria group bacterium]|nr:protein translocase subunit SecF [Patescibacteria group bacterium]